MPLEVEATRSRRLLDLKIFKENLSIFCSVPLENVLQNVHKDSSKIIIIFDWAVSCTFINWIRLCEKSIIKNTVKFRIFLLSKNVGLKLFDDFTILRIGGFAIDRFLIWRGCCKFRGRFLTFRRRHHIFFRYA